MVDFDSEVSGRPNDSNNYAVTRPTTVLTAAAYIHFEYCVERSNITVHDDPF